MKKRSLAAVACVLCLALLCGCQSAVTAGSAPAQANSAASTPVSTGTLTLACTGSASNPYVAGDALTRQNATLLFSLLVEITPDLDLDYALAQSVNNSGTLVTIQVRGGCYFADGSAISAQDVAASLQAACSSSAYGQRFANVAQVAVEGSAVQITLNTPDSLFAYLLDIPVLRADEVGQERPTPSGRYTYGADQTTLVRNPRAPFAQAGPDSIRLVQVSNSDELISGLAMGSISLYVDGEGSSATSVNTGESYFRSNTLIFAGINAYAANPLCNTAEGRALLSALCSRNDLAARAYSAQGYAATGVVNSYYPCARGRQTILAGADLTGLETTMAQLGYEKNEETGFYETARGAQAAVQLLVYASSSGRRTAAQLLAGQWQSAGIRVDITEASTFDAYLQAIHSGEFELYIGEVKLYNNIDLAPFWSGEASYGLAPSETLLAAYAAFKDNAGAVEAFEAAFAAEMPFLPLLWHSGTVITGRRVNGVTPSLSGPFYSLEGLWVSE